MELEQTGWENVAIVQNRAPFWSKQLRTQDTCLVLYAYHSYNGTVIIKQSLRLFDYVVQEDTIEISIDMLQDILEKGLLST